MARRFPVDYENDAGLWIPRSGIPRFDYSDGDPAENRILDMVKAATDVSLFSATLRQGISDWPSLYHLSPARANLVRPFATRLATGKILEVGAGCGAMTRYLGEIGATVTAIEGSLRRAWIARERTRGLPNVSVVCERIEEFSSEERYDAILLIGVLEYARLYLGHGPDAQHRLLQQLAGMLSPDGLVLVAIENQLGLKYFAGANEDHAGKPFFGINDQYSAASFATFGRAELSRILSDAGLGQQAWYFPFPDYKLPTAVISEKCLDRKASLASDLIALSTIYDAQRPPDPLFSLESTIDVLVRNGLIGELSNSFLVAAGPRKKAVEGITPSSALAWNYATSRHAAFVKEGRFVERSGRLAIVRSRLTTAPTPPIPLEWSLKDEDFVHGLNWWTELCRIVNTPGWQAADVAGWTRTWVDALRALISADGETAELDQRTLVDGKYFDATPFNLIRAEDGTFHFIDQEWAFAGKLDWLFLVLRGLQQSLLRITSVAEPADGTPVNIGHLSKAVVAHLGMLISDDDIRRGAEFEGRIQKWVLGEQDEFVEPERYAAIEARELSIRNHPARAALNAQIQHLRAIAEARAHETDMRLVERDRELQTAREMAARRDAAIVAHERYVAELEQKIAALTETVRTQHDTIDAGARALREASENLAARDRSIDELRATVRERDDRIATLDRMLAEIYRSTSWRITAPLRALRTRLAKVLSWLPGWRGLRRRRYALTPVPQHALSGSGETWTSTGDDPHFHLHSFPRLPRGWVRIRIGLKADDFAPLTPTLYVDTGSGWSEDTVVRLPLPQDDGIDTIQRLPDRVVSLRFDPVDRPCQFTLQRFDMQELSRIEAAVRLTWRYLRKHITSWRDVANGLRRFRRAYAEGGLPLVKHRIANTEAPPPGGDYQEWVRRYDQLTDRDRAFIRARIAKMPRRPKFSVIMPVYNTDLKWLRAAIESVRSQLYPDWELCISDNASTLAEVPAELRRYAENDKRIRVTFREVNGHISANSNSALSLATGEFIVLVDSDDILPEHALYWVAEELNAHPDADLIYSDEDKIDSEGRRFDPYFKPDWNPALMLSQNCFSHLGVYRRTLVEKVGGFRLGFEGSQDHDLVLRCADETEVSHIRHIPRILYHWRAIEGSTAVSVDFKAYAWAAGARAIEEHLTRQGISGRVTRALGMFYQVEYDLPKDLPLVSIIVPTSGRIDLMRPVVSSVLERTSYSNFELLIVVNERTLDVAEQACFLREIAANERVRVLAYENRPFNYSWTNNWAVQHAKGSILCMLNDDVEIITTDWLEQFVARLNIDRVAAVGAMLYYPNDTIQHAGVILGLGGVAGHVFVNLPRGTPGYFGRAALEQDLTCVTAACMAIRREAFEELGGFDEEFAVAFNDVDLCIRLREKGWRILWTPQVQHYHRESTSIGRHDRPERQELFRKEIARMEECWSSVIENDPFFNPNLSRFDHRVRLAFPPRISKLPSIDKQKHTTKLATDAY